jgi:hypothetical protein
MLTPAPSSLVSLHNRVLALGQSTPFNYLSELQQFASSLALNQTKDANIFIDPAYKWMSINGCTLHFTKFRDGIASLIQSIQEKYSILTDGYWSTLDPSPCPDDFANSQLGYSFLDEQPFKATSHNLLHILVQKHHLASLDSEGSLSWNPVQVKKVLHLAEEIWMQMYHVLYLTAHIGTRATQFLSIQIRNGDRQRNVFVQGDEMLFISRYSKTTNITDKDSCIPAFLPKPVRRLLLELLGGGLREAESILVGVLHGQSARSIYRT